MSSPACPTMSTRMLANSRRWAPHILGAAKGPSEALNKEIRCRRSRPTNEKGTERAESHVGTFAACGILYRGTSAER